MPFYTESKKKKKEISLEKELILGDNRKARGAKVSFYPEDMEILKTMLRKWLKNAGGRRKEFFVNIIKTWLLYSLTI